MNTGDQIRLLTGVKDRLMEKGWRKGAYGDGAGPNCLLGAAYIVAADHRLYGGADCTHESLRNALGIPDVILYNDHDARDFNDVVDLIDSRLITLKESL